MNREEMLKSANPIPFNREMVRAILDGRKTETRRRITGLPDGVYAVQASVFDDDGNPEVWDFMYGGAGDNFFLDMYMPIGQPYLVRDILYVQEEYAQIFGRNVYRADYDKVSKEMEQMWRPPKDMPKEAARIFLRVKNVNVEKLQDIKMHGMIKEGVVPPNVTGGQWQQWQNDYMKPAWDETVKPCDREKYGWDANPWVWVIEFERVDE